MDEELEDRTYNYTTTKQHIKDWFEENRWWVEDLSPENQLKLAQSFYIYQVYENQRDSSIIPQDEKTREDHALFLFEKMGLQKKYKQDDFKLKLRTLKGTPTPATYSSSPFFLTHKDGETTLTSFKAFPTIDLRDLKKEASVVIQNIYRAKKMLKTLKKEKAELESKMKQEKDEKEKERLKAEYETLLKKQQDEQQFIDEFASLAAITTENMYGKVTPPATLTSPSGTPIGTVTSHSLSEQDQKKKTTWFLGQFDQYQSLFREVYLYTNESKSILNAFIYLIAKVNSFDKNQIETTKKEIQEFIKSATTSDGAEWSIASYFNSDNNELVRMLTYDIINDTTFFPEDVKGLVKETDESVKVSEDKIRSLVESLVKFVIYDEVKQKNILDETTIQLDENQIKEKVNNIYEVKYIIKSRENFDKMELFDDVMREPIYNKEWYILIKSYIDAVENVYQNLEGRYTSKSDKVKINKMKVILWEFLRLSYSDPDPKKFNILPGSIVLWNLYGEPIEERRKKYPEPLVLVKDSDYVKAFYQNMLHMYHKDPYGDDVPYLVKFFYDLIYFAYIHYRPDLFYEDHQPCLDIWDLKVPFVVNLRDWSKNTSHYKLQPKKDQFDQYDMEDFYKRIITNRCEKSTISSDLIDTKIDDETIYSIGWKKLNKSTDKPTTDILQVITILKATSNTETADETVKIVQRALIEKLSDTNIDVKRKNLFRCYLSDLTYGTKFVRKTSMNNLCSNMSFEVTSNKDCKYSRALLNYYDNSSAITWGDDKYQYPMIQYDPSPGSSPDGGRRKSKSRNNIIYNKKHMDGASIREVSITKQFENLLLDETILMISMLTIHQLGVNVFKNEQDISINTDEAISSGKLIKFKMKIVVDGSSHRILSTVTLTDKSLLSRTFTLSQDDIDNFKKQFNIWSNKADVGLDVTKDLVGNVKEILRKQTTKTIDVFSAVSKVLRRYQHLINKYGYDDVSKRYKTSDGGKEGYITGDDNFDKRFVQNVLSAVGYIYRNQKNMINDFNATLNEYLINGTKHKLGVEESKTEDTTINVFESGWLGYGSPVSTVRISKGFLPEKQIKYYFYSEKTPPQILNIDVIENEDILIKYIWTVSLYINDLRKTSEFKSFSSLKSFLPSTKVLISIALAVALILAAVYNYDDIMNTLDKNGLYVPEYLRSFIPKIQDVLPESSKEIIKNAVNPLISDRTCSMSDTCKLSISDTLDSLIKQGKTGVIFDEVIYTTRQQMESIMSKVPGMNMYEYFMKSVTGDIEGEYGIGRDGRYNKTTTKAHKRSTKAPKRSTKALKRSTKALKRSTKDGGKKILKRSTKALKTTQNQNMLYKRLRKSLKNKRKDGSDSCYVYKTPF